MDETGVIAMGAARSPAPPGPAPAWLRFGLGLIVLTRDTLGSVLADPGAPGAPADRGGSSPSAVEPLPRHAAWGMLVDLLDRGRRTPEALRDHLSRVSMSARRFAPSLARARRLARHLPGAKRSAAHWHAWRARRWTQLARWATVGQREEAASRIVARQALIALREAALARVAESPDLKRVIREQSAGIAVTAVTELRNRSARADALAERAVRRLFGRRESDGSG